MISTVQITKVVDARVLVEHDDELTEAEVLELVRDRAFDLAPSICWWEASEKTSPTKVMLGVAENPHEAPEYGCCMPSAPKPFDLMSDPTDPEDD